MDVANTYGRRPDSLMRSAYIAAVYAQRAVATTLPIKYLRSLSRESPECPTSSNMSSPLPLRDDPAVGLGVVLDAEDTAESATFAMQQWTHELAHHLSKV